MPTLAELMVPKGAKQLLDALLARLRTRELPVDDWVPGGVLRTALEIEAEVQADLYALVPKIAEGGLLDKAEGDWLDLVVESQYGLLRKQAVFAEGTIRLSVEAGKGPYTIAVGDLWLTTADGKRFTNITGGTLNAGGTLDLTIKAEGSGSAYNVASGTITTMLTPLPGVTATNPAGWQTVTGADKESNTALRNRSKLRWADLGKGGTKAAYEYWALTSHSSVTKVKVLDTQPRGQGSLDVVLAGDAALAADVVTAANTYIQDRRPLTADVSVYAATAKTVTITGTGKVKKGYKAQAESEIATNLSQLARDTAIGGVLYDGGVFKQVMNATGMVDATFTGLADATALTATEFLVLTIDFVNGFVLTEV